MRTSEDGQLRILLSCRSRLVFEVHGSGRRTSCANTYVHVRCLVCRYIPLNNVSPGHQAQFVVCNSNLSEAAVLGFEYGFSLENENALVMWEAQVWFRPHACNSKFDHQSAPMHQESATPRGMVARLFYVQSYFRPLDFISLRQIHDGNNKREKEGPLSRANSIQDVCEMKSRGKAVAFIN